VRQVPVEIKQLVSLTISDKKRATTVKNVSNTCGQMPMQLVLQVSYLKERDATLGECWLPWSFARMPSSSDVTSPRRSVRHTSTLCFQFVAPNRLVSFSSCEVIFVRSAHVLRLLRNKNDGVRPIPLCFVIRGLLL